MRRRLIEIIPLTEIAPDAVETLLDDAFGTDRHARTAYLLRAGTTAIESLSFAARDNGELVGTLQSWPVALANDDGQCALTLVGPVAISPMLQRGGIGRILMTHMLALADAGESDAMMMIGDPEYYGRFFGFTADATGGWILPGPVERRRLLARLSRPGGVPRNGQIIPAPRQGTAGDKAFALI